MELYDFFLYFFFYGFSGWCAEVAFAACKTGKFVNRGFLNGPICPIYGIGVSIVIAFLTPFKSNFILLYLASVILVTLLEGITGWGMDVIFHHKWWDYSNMPLNIGGYVCLLFSVLWGIACVLIVYFIHPPITKLTSFLPVWLGWSFIAILGMILLIDLYVTTTAIFKFNRQLESMEKIAAELHKISDHIGEDIYERTIQAMEYQESIQENIQVKVEDIQEKMEDIQEKMEDSKQKLEDARQKLEDALPTCESSVQYLSEISDELREHILDLTTRYRTLRISSNPVSRRLMKAFPQLESKNYKEQLQTIKTELKNEIKKRTQSR